VVRRARETVCMVTYRKEGVDCGKRRKKSDGGGGVFSDSGGVCIGM
jgi:hypothetical protein